MLYLNTIHYQKDKYLLEYVTFWIQVAIENAEKKHRGVGFCVDESIPFKVHQTIANTDKWSEQTLVENDGEIRNSRNLVCVI